MAATAIGTLPVMPAKGHARPGRPNSLTHDQIIESALGLVGSRRLEDVSMREIAADLDVSVMTLYNYVANKDELNTLAVDHILRTVEIPGHDTGTWQDRMRQLQRNARSAMAHYRGVSLRNGPQSTEAARLADGVLSILATAGYGKADAARAFTVVYTFMLGQVEVDAFTDPTSDRREATLEAVTPQTDTTTDDLFEFGFNVVLGGLEAALGPLGHTQN